MTALFTHVTAVLEVRWRQTPVTEGFFRLRVARGWSGIGLPTAPGGEATQPPGFIFKLGGALVRLNGEWRVAGYPDLGNGNLPIAIVLAAVLVIIACSLWRVGKQRERVRRRAARRARRAEEDRIWEEHFGAK